MPTPKQTKVSKSPKGTKTTGKRPARGPSKTTPADVAPKLPVNLAAAISAHHCAPAAEKKIALRAGKLAAKRLAAAVEKTVGFYLPFLIVAHAMATGREVKELAAELAEFDADDWAELANPDGAGGEVGGEFLPIIAATLAEVLPVQKESA